FCGGLEALIEPRDVFREAALRLGGLDDALAAGGDARLPAVDLELELVELVRSDAAGAGRFLDGEPLRGDLGFQGRQTGRAFRLHRTRGRLELAQARQLRIQTPGLRAEPHRLLRPELVAEPPVPPGLGGLAL